MSFTFSNNTLSSDSGNININDNIYIHPGKIFETQQYFSKNNYVFKRDALCPIAYIAVRCPNTSIQGSCIFNHSTGLLENLTSIEANVYLPPYYNDIMALLSSKAINTSKQFYWSCVTSPFATTHANAVTEKANFLQGLKPLKTLYSASAIPTINTKPTLVTTTLSNTAKPVSVKTQSTTQIWIQDNMIDKWSYVIIAVKVQK